MCTLIAKILEDGFIMSMNRDNPVGREYGGYKKSDEFVYPLVQVTADSQGTWLATTKKGEVYALLDGKKATGVEDLVGAPSRGLIVPKLLAGEDINPTEYNPFQVFVYDGNKTATYINWDGKDEVRKTYTVGDKIVVVSSSYGYEQAKIDYVLNNFPTTEEEFKQILLVEDPQIFLHESKSETIGSSYIKVTNQKVVFQNGLQPDFKDFEEFILEK